MGSWSESCGLSGLEIGEGETAYVMVLRGPTFEYGHGPYTNFVPCSTLIKGTYNDYGYLAIDDEPEILEVFNQQTGLNLKQGNDFSRNAMEDQSGQSLGDNRYRFWVHGKIFDRLGELEQDFPYVFTKVGKNKTNVETSCLGESMDILFENQTKDYQETAKLIKELKEKDELDFKEKMISIALLLMNSEWGAAGPLKSSYHEMIVKRIKANQSFDAILQAKRRNDLLAGAAYELRKKIIPSEGVGPQHGGSQASVGFANIVLETQAQRAEDRDYD